MDARVRCVCPCMSPRDTSVLTYHPFGTCSGRGVLPTTLPFAFADAFTSTLDFVTVLKTLAAWIKLAAPELLFHGAF